MEGGWGERKAERTQIKKFFSACHGRGPQVCHMANAVLLLPYPVQLILFLKDFILERKGRAGGGAEGE